MSHSEGADGGRRHEPRAGRRRRALAAVLALVLVIALAGLGAEQVARARLHSAVREAVPGLSEDAEVTTQGLLLPQVLADRFDCLKVGASRLHLERPARDGAVTSLDLHDVSATLTGVSVSTPATAQRLDASGTITWQDLAVIVADASPDLEEVALAPAQHGTASAPGTFTATSEILGAEGVFVVVPSLTEDGSMLMTVTRATVAGVSLDLDDEEHLAMRLLGLSTPEFLVDRALLPAPLAYDGVVVADEGLRVSISGQDLNLEDLADQGRR